ncbi:hypothetical protein DL766_005498 [Monosporascus sp. MC13-8B]|uniref:Amino acid permease/ SLC12A domain-containing protein n=1 Tax=Monosporascus cannonballus TaxID=155416 RepID=A0ABY0HD19_9PEZI|nr:hypothetical protein DL762_004185 [Monosporascus cannonballus]RYP29211.1 hypothetical protein DL766_005498 [Monosporascus sp. MC13-8B]
MDAAARRIERHGGRDGYFRIAFGDREIWGVAWLPRDMHRSPHHRFAIASGILNVLASLFVVVLFAASAENIQQHRLLILAFGPAFVLATAALVSGFAVHFATGDGLNPYLLHPTTSSSGPSGPPLRRAVPQRPAGPRELELGNRLGSVPRGPRVEGEEGR